MMAQQNKAMGIQVLGHRLSFVLAKPKKMGKMKCYRRMNVGEYLNSICHLDRVTAQGISDGAVSHLYAQC